MQLMDNPAASDRKGSVLLHYNLPQIRGAVVRARTEILLAARRAGKTTGVIAERVSWNAFQLPRSLGGIMMPSHKKFLTSFISSFIDGLESLGYVEEKDFFIGRRGPKHWEQPYHRPKKYDYALHWRSGSAESFISQFAGSAGAGQTLDRLVGDEAKYLDGDQFEEETLAAMSGHPHIFRDEPEHRSLLITSDRPYAAKGRWFFKYKDLMDPVVIRAIMQLQVEIQHYELRIRKGGLTDGTVATYQHRIRQLHQANNILRAQATYWHEATTIDNIHAVGLPYIKLMAEKMDPIPFRVSLLNEDVAFVTGGFYPDLDDDYHGYHPQASSWTVSLGIDRAARAKLTAPDCRHDAELQPKLPLEIAMDYGSSFNCVVVAQRFDRTLRFDNALHVYHPLKVRDVVHRFIEYYLHHPCKEVIYYYDQTAVGHDGRSSFSYMEIVVDELRKAGWSVKPVYIGPQPKHHLRYELWGEFLSKETNPPFDVRFNLDNCENLLMSMHSTAAKQDGREGFRKDKSAEKDPAYDQAHAPHLSDAADTLLIGHSSNVMDRVSLPSASGFA